MNKYFLLSISFVLLIGCNSFPLVSTPTMTPDEIEVEEYKIYKIVIAQYIFEDIEQIVIWDHTKTFWKMDEDLSKIADNIFDIDKDTIENFRDANKESRLLRNDFDLGIPLILLSSDEGSEIFKPKINGWDVFYEKFPHSRGIMGVSRVGFNQVGNQALIYVWNQEYWEVGKGYYLFLTKEDGIWVIQEKVASWVS